MGVYQVQPFRVRVDVGVMVMKGYSTLLKNSINHIIFEPKRSLKYLGIMKDDPF